MLSIYKPKISKLPIEIFEILLIITTHKLKIMISAPVFDIIHFHSYVCLTLNSTKFKCINYLLCEEKKILIYCINANLDHILIFNDVKINLQDFGIP